ncbi:MAG: hypothetical protein CL916_02760 [Deltaproteobacteria bacterium]|nr:hypothetical protein [Deltaproteobacteria bacterium]
MPTIETLGPLRHICHASGGCCQGNVAMLKKTEEAQVQRQAQILQIPDPVHDGAIRKIGGSCTFLNPEHLCRIHAQFGEPNKPTVCKQFPLVAIHTEEEIRIGVDPGCLSAWKTWKDGPQIQPGALISTKNPISQQLRQHEQKLLDLLSIEGATIYGVIEKITGNATQFYQRWSKHLQSVPLIDILLREGTAPIFQEHLSPIALLSNESPPTLFSLPDQEEWVLESAQRMLYLRFLSKELTPHATILLCLGGALACSWAYTEPSTFGPAFAAWNRAIRSNLLLKTLLPAPQTLAWLVGQD